MPLFDRTKTFDVVCDSCDLHEVMTQYQLHTSEWLVQGSVVICPSDRVKHVVRSLSQWIGSHYFHENGSTASLLSVERYEAAGKPKIMITLKDVVEGHLYTFSEVKEFLGSWSRTLL